MSATSQPESMAFGRKGKNGRLKICRRKFGLTLSRTHPSSKTKEKYFDDKFSFLLCLWARVWLRPFHQRVLSSSKFPLQAIFHIRKMTKTMRCGKYGEHQRCQWHYLIDAENKAMTKDASASSRLAIYSNTHTHSLTQTHLRFAWCKKINIVSVFWPGGGKL